MLALLALGEAAVNTFQVPVVIQVGADGQTSVDVEGQAHTTGVAPVYPFRRVQFQQPGPLQREYQVDGSDTTANDDRRPATLQPLLQTPLYRLDSWLRDEDSYSRWDQARLLDGSGRLIASGVDAVAAATLPATFRLEVSLRRPEAPAQVWLVESDGTSRQGLELDRDKRNALWKVQENGQQHDLPRWFFPEQPLPFLAEILQLVGRSAALLLAATATAIGLALGVRRVRGVSRQPGGVRGSWFDKLTTNGGMGSATGRLGLVVVVGLLCVSSLAGGAWIAVVDYQQLPHVLDAVSYVFQAGVLASGHFAVTPLPPITPAFVGPFQLVRNDLWYSQYPPGAPALFALGSKLGAEWLVGPVATAVMIGLSAYAAYRLFGAGTALLVGLLGALSPFILFQAGSYLSHSIAAVFLAGALVAFTLARDGRVVGALLLGGCLGAAFLTRETSAVLFGLPLGVWLLARRRFTQLAWAGLACVPFLLLYGWYNHALTGNPFLLPRELFAPNDHFGFGNGIGFHTRHTVAAGLANADELLTILQFDLFGWPPLALYALLLAPFLFGTAHREDVLLGAGFLLFVVAFVGYFYHGIVLGPRYYFEAIPYLLLLTARGLTAVVAFAHRFVPSLFAARLATAVLLALLCLNDVLFYLPGEVQRRLDYTDLAGSPALRLGFVQAALNGPQLVGVQTPALVLVPSWWWYMGDLAALNCPYISATTAQACPVLFALATSAKDEQALIQQYPGRNVLRVTQQGDALQLQPVGR